MSESAHVRRSQVFLAALTRVSLSPVQVVVPGTTALLQNLLPDTDYNIGVVALYSDGEGPAISDAGKTRKDPKTQPCSSPFAQVPVFSYTRRYALVFTLSPFMPGDPSATERTEEPSGV